MGQFVNFNGSALIGVVLLKNLFDGLFHDLITECCFALHCLQMNKLIYQQYMSTADPRNINLAEFVESRSIQLTNFLNTLAEKSNNKRCPQNVPKSVRRRAMSHNRYRIPRRMRQGIEEQLKVIQSTQKIPKCRKSLRRKHRLLMSYNQRSGKVYWLYTHLWAVKRMRMKDYFGYKVAERAIDKSSRACYRFANYGCCLVDMSYWEVGKVKQGLMIVEDEEGFKLWVQSKQPIYFEGWLTSQEKRRICPTLFFKEEGQFIYFIYHPAAKSQVLQIRDVTIIKGKLQLYRLLGPQSLIRLCQLLPMLNVQMTKELKNFDQGKDPNLFPHNLFLQLRVKNQLVRQKMVTSPSLLYTNYITQGYNGKSFNENLRATLHEIVNQKKEAFVEKNYTFWKDFEKQIDSSNQAVMTITTRSKYTHKRRNKIKKQDKVEVLRKLNVSIQNKLQTGRQQPMQIQEPQEKVSEVKQTSTQIVIPKSESSTNPVISVALVNNKTALTDGCYILSSPFQSAILWRKLTFLNAKVIGRKDLMKITCEAGQLNYPEDYPETEGYKSYIEDVRKEKIERYRHLPSNKRVKYERLNSPFPFGSNFGVLAKSKPFQQAFCRVQLLMVGRGIAPEHSYICLPNTQDIETFKERLQSEQTILSHIHSEEPIGEDMDIQDVELKGIHKLSDSELQKHFLSLNTSRRIIGFITSGGHSWQRCKGFSNGYVLKEFAHLDYYLTRKVSSCHYFLAEQQIVN